MLEDIFSGGRLEMSAEPLGKVIADPAWGDVLVNKILAALAIVLFLIALPDLVRLFPSLLDCCFRTKACTDLEHSVNRARQRNTCSNLLLLPFCLLASRFQLYQSSFFNGSIPFQWKAPATIGVILAYLLLRLLFFFFFGPNTNRENAQGAHHAGSNIFIVGSVLAFAIAGILSVTGLPDSVIRTVLLWETALFFFLTLIRCGQILAQYCTGFATFLYICALEIAPAAVIVCSAILL